MARATTATTASAPRPADAAPDPQELPLVPPPVPTTRQVKPPTSRLLDVNWIRTVHHRASGARPLKQPTPTV